jgi:hypothetical protein
MLHSGSRAIHGLLPTRFLSLFRRVLLQGRLMRPLVVMLFSREQSVGRCESSVHTRDPFGHLFMNISPKGCISPKRLRWRPSVAFRRDQSEDVDHAHAKR